LNDKQAKHFHYAAGDKSLRKDIDDANKKRSFFSPSLSKEELAYKYKKI
jgi:hypothetical protein